MDPISALSLACNVIQLVEFSVDSVKVCKELYDNGSIDENERIEKYTTDITAANKELQAALSNGKPSNKPSKIQQVAQDVSATANELKIALNKLKLSKSQGIRRLGNAFRSTLKTLITNGTIQRLQKRLELQDAALRSTLLKDLYIKAGESDVFMKKEFERLSEGQKQVIVQILNTQRLLSTEIISSIKSSESRIAGRLSAQDVQLSKNAEQHTLQLAILREEEFNVCKRRLLKALAFPEINERRNMIEGRVNDFGDTYKWIFDEAHDESLWEDASPEVSEDEYEPIIRKPLNAHSFVDWLRSGNDLFWVSGKPGSGKSTLMDYIYHNIQPGTTGSSVLKDWAGSDCVVILTFWFFRPASSPLLRTLHGLWRSLCFQILDADPKLTMTIREDEDGTAPRDLRSCLLPDGSNAESWTDKQLISWFWYLVEHSSMCYCVLIDGLDEIETTREVLLETVLSMSGRSNKLKLCCASRPENPFLDSLKHCPHLQLQDFNKADIEEDCRKRLMGTRAERFASRIAGRAEGVFLWAHLISRDLARAAKEGESEEDLRLRLEDCPDEMTDLFRYMLQRQDRMYTKNPKPYLQLIDFASSMDYNSATLLELLVATLPQSRCPKWSELDGQFDTEFMSYLEEQLDGLGPRIESKCAGLVQCHARSDYHERYGITLRSDPLYPRLDAAVETTVSLIHRSVHDFLREDEGVAAYYQRFKLTTEDAARMLVAGAASPLFLSNESLTWWWEFNAIPFCYAELLTKKRQDTKMTTALDAFVRQLVLRSLPTQEDKELFNHGLRIFSPDLSPYDNISIGLGSMYALHGYVQTKIFEAESTRRHALAAHALLSCLISLAEPGQVEFIEMLCSHFDAFQVYKIAYYDFVFYKDPISISTCSLIEHVIVGMLNKQRDQDMIRPDYLQVLQGLFNPYGALTPDFGFVEGWMLFTEYSYGWRILPRPDQDCVFMKENLKDSLIMIWQALPHDVLQMIYYPLKIVRWSPAGTKKFLPISEAVQQQFCKIHDRRSWDRLWQAFGAALVESLNSSLNDFDETELEEIKTANFRISDVDEDDKFKIGSPHNEVWSQLRLVWSSWNTEDDNPDSHFDDEDNDEDNDDDGGDGDDSLLGTEEEMLSPMESPSDTHLPVL